MRAWLIDDFTGIKNLRLADVAEPTPASGEVVLDVLFAALNPADRYLAAAQYPAKPPLPHVLGRDGVGVVREVGAGATGLNVGDTCAILRGETGVSRWGTLAERVAISTDSLVPVPRGWTLEQASAATLVYLTAYQALTQWPDLPAKSVVLVTGASGGVGVASVQLAVAMGHTVVGLSRDAQKSERLRELGASIVLDPNQPKWRQELKTQMPGQRVDLAIDNIGGRLLPQVIESLGDFGRVSLVGRLAGPVPEFNTAALFFKRLKLGGVAVGSYSNEQSRAAWKDILQLLDRAGARPLVDRVLPFEEVPGAFARLEEGPMGKVVVKVR